MDPCDFVDTILKIGEKYSINTGDIKSLIFKLIVLSVKFVSKEALWDEKFKDEHVHWELVNHQNNKNIVGGYSEWITLLSFCSWENIAKVEGLVISTYPMLHVLRSHLRESNIDIGGPESWTLTCKILLLTLIQGLPSLHAIEASFNFFNEYNQFSL